MIQEKLGLHPDQHRVMITPEEAIRLRREMSCEEYGFAIEMARCYGAVPCEDSKHYLYQFIVDIFNAGRITGQRIERERNALRKENING